MTERPVFVFVGQDKDAKARTRRAKMLDALLAKHGDPGRPSSGATAESTLAGLIAWVKQWAAHPSNDAARILLIYDPGYRDERAAAFTVACDPDAFASILIMASPEDWQKS